VAGRCGTGRHPWSDHGVLVGQGEPGNAGLVDIPGILANAGGVTVSYFYWLREIDQRSPSLERVHDELETGTRSAWDASWREYEARSVTWGEATDVVALSRIVAAQEARGLRQESARRRPPRFCAVPPNDGP
jgi:glutamate dehydrogenase/leucine dehydrogenase